MFGEGGTLGGRGPSASPGEGQRRERKERGQRITLQLTTLKH